MIITLDPKLDSRCAIARQEAIEAVACEHGLKVHPVYGANKTLLCIVGEFNGQYSTLLDNFQAMEGVESVHQVMEPYKLAGRTSHPDNTIVEVGSVCIGNGSLTHIAGPCAVESEQQIRDIAHAVHNAGGHILRGGAFKPRTSPYSFQGLGEDGLKMLRDAGEEVGMPTVTEVLDTRDVPLVAEHADMLQIGARNMQNFGLLKEVGETGMPVLLKRGMSARIVDLLMSAEYVLSRRNGTSNVVLCERGVTGFDTQTRNQIDMSAIPVLHNLTHLPVVLDPSHAVGVREYIPSMALAGVAAGADGVHVEVHTHPEQAFSDGKQSLIPEQYAQLVERMGVIHSAVRDLYVRH
ncbi:3-deoxy-7-phosphoheptulonate synthase [Candidatus Peregrinibacteria bacterium CG10_big_fil_rev_8_21_14_0_10_55_24]|nr:MAG: 3-deoxy-7-phosphoheptulonate synthase [Candidatus Peregrinibacteria bacterium CG10_big_fil_rev_8_21_14_0_10_55_24]